ncbi:MAG: menaquinone biosynthesis protein [Armatimonadota bacterium]|nr:menaquinone biosynthesis protein [Armatimonadota bacterium]
MPTIGCLPYLNVKPLSYLLEREPLPEGWDLTYAPPARLAEMLRTGEICAAPVSSFACFENPDLRIVPDICIASRGRVTSVLVFSNRPVEEISTIAVDSGSLSGAAMLRIILKERYDISPAFNMSDPDPDLMLRANDACLTLGNRAMQYDAKRSRGLRVLDLGEEWLDLTGLPAVFAVWAVTPDAPVQELIPMLVRSKDAGIEAVDEIALEESLKLDLSYDVCRRYLSEVMVYDMGPDELQSLNLFAQKARLHGLISGVPDLVLAAPGKSIGGRV